MIYVKRIIFVIFFNLVFLNSVFGAENFFEEAKKKFEKNSVDFCHYLNQCVSNSIRYLSGTTNIHTSAVDAISQGSGVCQDFSHILVGLARFYGYPARYVNGFMLDNTDLASNDFSTLWTSLYKFATEPDMMSI